MTKPLSLKMLYNQNSFLGYYFNFMLWSFFRKHQLGWCTVQIMWYQVPIRKFQFSVFFIQPPISEKLKISTDLSLSHFSNTYQHFGWLPLLQLHYKSFLPQVQFANHLMMDFLTMSISSQPHFDDDDDEDGATQKIPRISNWSLLTLVANTELETVVITIGLC